MVFSFCNVKYLVLFLLVIQNTLYVILVRYTRTRPGTMYLSSTAVCCDEAMKLITCLCILTITYLFTKQRQFDKDGGGKYSQLRSENNDTSCVSAEHKADDRRDDDEDLEKNDIDRITINRSDVSFRSYISQQLQFDYRVAGLAGLYVVQKQFLYMAMSNLDAAIFQVTYQIKTLLTAVFSVILLQKKLTTLQIMALISLTVGVAIVQLDKVDENASESGQEQNRWVGLLAVLGASCTSGFGGVYFELVLKPRPNSAEASKTKLPHHQNPSVWAKNVQLSTFGLIIALVTAFGKDGRAILTEGFFQGYTQWVVAVIVLQAMGGLIVAAIIKYADNILKSFAAAMSIVGSTIISAWVFDFSISKLFAWGCLLQFISIYLYARKSEGVNEKQQNISMMRGSSDNDAEVIELVEKKRRLSLFCRSSSTAIRNEST